MKILSFLKRHAKKIAVISAVSVAAVGAGVTAWGPSRPTFTIANPANYITFNSIVDNPNYGDERTFLDAKPATHASDGGFKDSNTVTNGQEILVRTYVHNNAADNLNLVATNTKVRMQLPTGTSKNMRMFSFISADNAQPQQVYDHTDLTGASAFSLDYVPGSATVYTNAVPKGMKASDSIVTSGAQIGYDQLNGKVPGCFKYTAIVTVKVKVKMPQPNFTMSKEVSKEGGPWVNDVTVKPGSTINYRVQFKNTGATTLNNVVIKDRLPAHMSYVPGSSKLFNSSNPNGLKISDNIVSSQGVNIGNYAPGANAYVVFKVKLGEESPEVCKAGKLRNIANVKPEGQNPKEDDANVTTECEQVPQFRCEALDADRLNVKLGETANFTARGSASNGASITGYIFKVNGAIVQDSANNRFAYTANAEGTYNVSAIVKTNRGNTPEVANCQKQLKVTKENPQPIYECVDLTARPLGGNKYQFTTTIRTENASVNKYLYKFGDASQELSTTNAVVEHTYPGPGEYTAKVRVIFNVGNEQKTVESQNCEVTIKIVDNPCPYNPSLPKDAPNCKEQPGEKPPVEVIPSTGAAGIVTGIFGTSMTAYGAIALVEKRRALRK